MLDKDPIGLKVLADVHINSKVREAFGCSSERKKSEKKREKRRKKR